MEALKEHWHKALAYRQQAGSLRSLEVRNEGIDFFSNDYLGFAGNSLFQNYILEQIAAQPTCLTGSTGSRLISGNSTLAEEIEAHIADLHQVENALLFPSGYKANISLFSSIAGRHDTIILDELVHRSVHDGCRMSNARKWKFRHNDVEHLEFLLRKAQGRLLIAIESLYSVDGDFAPLQDMVALAKRYDAGLVVDEAHAIGVFGKGLVHRASLQQEVLASVATYGKAMGVQGAAVLGSSLLKEYLVNFASPFIYSTAPADVHLLGIRSAYDFLETHHHLPILLQEKIQYFRQQGVHCGSEDGSPIQLVRFHTREGLKNVTQALKDACIHVYPLFAPTVPEGKERLRICIHAFNTRQDIDLLCNIIQQYDYVR